MSLKTYLTYGVAAAMTAILGGCVPSDAEVTREIDQSRYEAYAEWKASRDRGVTREVKVDGPLSLDDAIKLALQYNKPLQTWIQQRDVTRGERISTYAVILPSLRVTGGAARVENGRGNSDIDRYSAGVTVTQPIFQGEAIPAQLRSARLSTALTDEQIREQVQNLISETAGNYYDVLLAQHMVDVYRESLTSAETQFRMVSEKKKQETATEYDVLRAQVDVATYQARMISAQNSIDNNRVSLLKNMGVSQDSNITFSDKLEFLPMRPVFERAVQLASCLRPDVRQAELDARIAEEAVRVARSEFWPSLSGYFETGWSDGWSGYRDSFGRNPWQAGLSLTYNFDAGNIGDLRKFRAQARQRQIDILDRQETALKEIRMYMNSLANAEEMVKALEVNQDAAREALRLMMVGYQAGVRTEVDVTDARKALTEVMGQYYEALTDHTKARLNLQVAMGVLGPSQITDGPPLPPRVPIANIQEFAATDYVPPKPISMPAADSSDPTSLMTPVSRPMSVAPASPEMYQQPVSVAPTPAAIQVPAPAPQAPAPVQVQVESSQAAPAPVLSASQLPTPPSQESGIAAAAVQQPIPDAANTRIVSTPLSSAPQTEATPEKPLFKIRVREGSRDLPEMARAE